MHRRVIAQLEREQHEAEAHARRGREQVGRPGALLEVDERGGPLVARSVLVNVVHAVRVFPRKTPAPGDVPAALGSAVASGDPTSTFLVVEMPLLRVGWVGWSESLPDVLNELGFGCNGNAALLQGICNGQRIVSGCNLDLELVGREGQTPHNRELTLFQFTPDRRVR